MQWDGEEPPWSTPELLSCMSGCCFTAPRHGWTQPMSGMLKEVSLHKHLPYCQGSFADSQGKTTQGIWAGVGEPPGYALNHLTWWSQGCTITTWHSSRRGRGHFSKGALEYRGLPESTLLHWPHAAPFWRAEKELERKQRKEKIFQKSLERAAAAF